MRILLLGALAALVAAPLAARAEPRLLDRSLVRPVLLSPALGLAQAPGASGQEEDENGKAKPRPEAPGTGPDLDFDLLGEAEPPPLVEESPAMRRRRKMLGIHQGLGLGLLALQAGTTVVGQLNYNDKFGDANTGRYERTHAVLAYTTVAVFATQGLLGVLAPDRPQKLERGFDRVTLHKIAMFTAAAGIVAQAGLGFYTARREGYLDKQDFGRAHLVVGYATAAAVATGVAAFVF
jgi:hypothetical protein